MPAQLLLPFSPVQNRNTFSGHWLDHRLSLEPDWAESADAATDALAELTEMWKVERKRVGGYGNEAHLEIAFIQPVLKALGWKLKYQPHLHGRKPDYALFLSDADLDTALTREPTSDAFWTPAAVVADAKKWDLPLDKKVGNGTKKEYPPEQMEWYLDRSRKPFGILTNGRVWRLVPRELKPHQRRYQTYYEVDLVAILDEAVQPGGADFGTREDFLRFFLFFGPSGFTPRDGRKPLIERAVEGSSEYRVGVSEDLKGQAFEALRLCIEGFLAFERNQFNPNTELGTCRELSFILLCRLLFILFAEDRRLLPYKVNRTYTDNRSLGKLRDDIAARLDKVRLGEPDYSRTETGLWDDLCQLFDLIDAGGGRYGVPAYNGGLFDPAAHPLLAEKKLADYHLARIIDQLSRTTDRKDPALGRFRVDYRDLALQHLGGIYEGLLENRPERATVPMHLFSRRNKGVLEEVYIPDSESPPAGFVRSEIDCGEGSIYLVKDKNERRTFGSYYTPDHIVDHIIRETVGPLCERITNDIGVEIERAKAANAPEAEIERLEDDFPNRLLKLRVLDPAMGSGHFLLSACQYLAEQLATNPYTPPGPDAGTADDLSFWKRKVIENCLYGVDLNRLAVDLARLALWLETVAKDRPLTFLDHHLKYGNSLVGARLNRLAKRAGKPKMPAGPFDAAFRSKLPSLLDPLAEIGRLPSDTVKDIKEKEKQYKAYERAVLPFRQLADLWTADASGRATDSKHYLSALKALGKAEAFKRMTVEDWFLGPNTWAALELHPFHWDLAYPEVFCDANGPRADGGFDAIIGNPPYEVLSDKETGHDLSPLRKFIKTEPTYRPAVQGKQNLFKLFICRGVDLLRPDGRFGFIVPMALLGDEITSDLRRHMAEAGEFLAVEGFPQKDNAKKRVFEDAKLSTVAFVYAKGRDPAAPRSFRCRLHPENEVQADSTSLILSTADIPNYDPDNFTIVCCPQTDWDLATRIMKSGRMARLGRFAEFFQGEVNETNEKKKGTLTKPKQGRLVIRGAGVCLYTTRPASQGEDLYLDVAKFTAQKGEDTKAFHHRHPRVGWQESCPQNNFRRIVAALIPAGEFCNHTVNYLPGHCSELPLEFVVGLLNSLLADWYFRLGSTNAHVSHYQIQNLPCPEFSAAPTQSEKATGAQVAAQFAAGAPTQALQLLAPLLDAAPPFSPVIRDAVVAAVVRITAIEAGREDMSRADRSALDPAAQPYQDFLDAVLFRLAGLTDAEAADLRHRYETVLKKLK